MKIPCGYIQVYKIGKINRVVGQQLFKILTSKHKIFKNGNNIILNL